MDINNMFMCAIPDQPFFHQKTLFFFFSSFFYFYFYNVWFSIGQLLQFGFLYAHKTHTQTRAETLNWEWQTSFSFEFFIFVIFIMRIICAVNMFYLLLLLFFVTGSNGELVCACVHGNEPANFIRTSDLQMHCKLVYGYTASGHSMKIGQLRCAIDSFESQLINFLTPAMQFQARMCYAVNVENQVSIDTTQRNHNKTLFDHVWPCLVLSDLIWFFGSSFLQFYFRIFQLIPLLLLCCFRHYIFETMWIQSRFLFGTNPRASSGEKKTFKIKGITMYLSSFIKQSVSLFFHS